EDAADRGGATGAQQAVGVLASRQGEKAQALAGLQQRQRPLGGARRGPAAGIVAVEAKVRLVGELPQFEHLAFGQSRAKRRHGAGKTSGLESAPPPFASRPPPPPPPRPPPPPP